MPFFSYMLTLIHLCTAICIFIPWCRKHWKWNALPKFEGSKDLLQRPRFFLTETYFSEEITQSENLSMFEFNPFTFILISYKSALIFYHLI